MDELEENAFYALLDGIEEGDEGDGFLKAPDINLHLVRNTLLCDSHLTSLKTWDSNPNIDDDDVEEDVDSNARNLTDSSALLSDHPPCRAKWRLVNSQEAVSR